MDIIDEANETMARAKAEILHLRAINAELVDVLQSLQTQLFPDAMCKEKGGLTATSRMRCMAIVKDALTHAKGES